jgi:O-antigen ligase
MLLTGRSPRLKTFSMSLRFGPADFARACFFALLPAAAGSGAMALPLLMGATGVASLRFPRFNQPIEKPSIILILLAAFAGWAAISTLWSPWHGATAAKIVPLVALGLVFVSTAGANAQAARLTLAAATSAFLVTAMLLSIEAFFDLPLNRAAAPGASTFEANQNPARGLVVMLALLWPALAWLLGYGGRARIAAAGAIAVAGGALSLHFHQLSTAVGFALGFAIFAAAFAAPRVSVSAISWSLAFWMLAAPFLTPLLTTNPRFAEMLQFSAAARIAIWRNVCAQILDRPWFGHGLDAGRAADRVIVVRGESMDGIPVHPHSASLQIWYELGVIGAALAAALLAYGGWLLARAYAHDKPAAAAAAATLTMFGFMANVGWSLWQEWWMATLLLSAALVGAVAARGARASRL